MLIATRFVQGTPQFDRLARDYVERGHEHPALHAYPTLRMLLSALSKAGAPLDVRSQIVCALITRWRRTHDPLWSSILLQTFDGMLGRLRNRPRGPHRDDAECLVTAAFLEALTRVRPSHDPARIAMYVRQETRRCLFASLRQDDDGEDVVPGVDIDAQPDPATLVPLESRIMAWDPTPAMVTDEELLRTLPIRGGLRLLTRYLLPDASRRNQEHFYRCLLARRTRLATKLRAGGAARRASQGRGRSLL
jgi:hypothetical protein